MDGKEDTILADIESMRGRVREYNLTNGIHTRRSKA